MSSDNLTEQEAQDLLRQFSDSKANMHSFFTAVVKATDTSKTGNLSQEELGYGNLPLRTYKELEVFCKDIADQPDFADYFQKIGEVQSATSLSKDGFLMRLSVTQKKEMADMTPEKKENKGWFKKKETNPVQ